MLAHQTWKYAGGCEKWCSGGITLIHCNLVFSLHTCPQPPSLPAAAGLFRCSWRPPAVSPPSAAAQYGQRSGACPHQCTPLGWSGDMLPLRSANLSTVEGREWVMGREKTGETSENIRKQWQEKRKTKSKRKIWSYKISLCREER